MAYCDRCNRMFPHDGHTNSTGTTRIATGSATAAQLTLPARRVSSSTMQTVRNITIAETAIGILSVQSQRCNTWRQNTGIVRPMTGPSKQREVSIRTTGKALIITKDFDNDDRSWDYGEEGKGWVRPSTVVVIGDNEDMLRELQGGLSRARGTRQEIVHSARYYDNVLKIKEREKGDWMTIVPKRSGTHGCEPGFARDCPIVQITVWVSEHDGRCQISLRLDIQGREENMVESVGHAPPHGKLTEIEGDSNGDREY
ncbi:hypothetical protein BJV74DRAFT_799286 [Russula compacta]|nr:hypothetical protein BJV74DRAFT_799286 [Russula compacta]